MKKLSKLIDLLLDGSDHSVVPTLFVCVMLFCMLIPVYISLMLALGYRS